PLLPFFSITATLATDVYTLSLHDALPICRTYRLAIGTSWQYSQYHGGTLASVMAAINTTMTRVNGIYDRELSIKMELVPDNDLIDRKSTRLNSSHVKISYAVFCLKNKKKK